MPYDAVHVGDHACAAHGIPDGVCLMPHDEPGMGPLDVQSRICNAQVSAGQQAHDCALRQMSSDCHELHPVLLPEQRMSQQLSGRRMIRGKTE